MEGGLPLVLCLAELARIALQSRCLRYEIDLCFQNGLKWMIQDGLCVWHFVMQSRSLRLLDELLATQAVQVRTMVKMNSGVRD